MLDTLPPFPMWPAFPTPEYYDGSAPSTRFGQRRTYPFLPDWLTTPKWTARQTVPAFTNCSIDK
ncbi:MAG TPA: hypothetical protein P5544_16385 [Candidatus Nanopelagicales bacterium]|nr:hypothetical protein [Candidatus Nanopelagicales bacterium]